VLGRSDHVQNVPNVARVDWYQLARGVQVIQRVKMRRGRHKRWRKDQVGIDVRDRHPISGRLRVADIAANVVKTEERRGKTKVKVSASRAKELVEDLRRGKGTTTGQVVRTVELPTAEEVAHQSFLILVHRNIPDEVERARVAAVISRKTFFLFGQIERVGSD